MPEPPEVFHCISCSYNMMKTFFFHRPLAAKAAVKLSKLNPRTLASNGQIYSASDEYSAMFMSFAYFAGGLPMIAARSSGNPTGPGWYAQCNSVHKIEGSMVWNGHRDETRHVLFGPDGYTDTLSNGTQVQYNENSDFVEKQLSDVDGNRLVQLIAGNYSAFSSDAMPVPPTGKKILITIHGANTLAFVAPIRKFFYIQEGTYKLTSSYFREGSAADGTTISAATAQANRSGLSKLFRAKAGDYLYYLSGVAGQAPTTGTGHGLMVVGRGPAFNWDKYMQKGDDVKTVPVGGPGEYGYQFDLNNKADMEFFHANSGDPAALDNFTNTFIQAGEASPVPPGAPPGVPYVADWHGGTAKTQGPRPFYATRAPAQGSVQAEHHYWVLVPAPSRVSVLCQYAFAINCLDAPIHVDVNAADDSTDILTHC